MGKLHTVKSNWAKITRTPKPVLVLFGAPWCSHCKPVKRRIEAIAARDDRIRCVYVDCKAVPEIADLYHVQLIPAVTVFHAGKPTADVPGPLDAKRLREAVEKAVASSEAE